MAQQPPSPSQPPILPPTPPRRVSRQHSNTPPFPPQDSHVLPPLAATQPHHQQLGPGPPVPPGPSEPSSGREETWMDFLMNPPPPAERPAAAERYLAERKRRLTALDAPYRRPNHPYSAPSMPSSSSSAAGAGAGVGVGAVVTAGDFGPSSSSPSSSSTLTPGAPHSNASDLLGRDVTSAVRQVPSSHMQNSQGSRHTDIALPRWQPDADVSYCPVCGNQFTFWYRKHHCRKCGRVVCAGCSPHRITIPRQFIVHPPMTAATSMIEDNSSPTSQNIWGGEEVRVCNPCVPDPNLSPPSLHPSDPFGRGLWSFAADLDGGSYPRQVASHRSTRSENNIMSSRHRASRDPFLNPGLRFQSPSTVRDLWPPSDTPHHSLYPQRTSSALAVGRPPYGGQPDVYSPSSSASSASHAVPTPISRRQIPEEDECPVCGQELPSKGDDGLTVEREAHIEECVQSHMYSAPTTTTSSSAPTNPLAVPVPSSSSRPLSHISNPTSVSSASSPGVSSAPTSTLPTGPARIRRMTGGGRMLVYRATEKDCVPSEEGTFQECVICLEEFEVGDEMGRLECLCKFHRKCIRSWWETKGAGSCPTHQLHE